MDKSSHFLKSKNLVLSGLKAKCRDEGWVRKTNILDIERGKNMTSAI